MEKISEEFIYHFFAEDILDNKVDGVIVLEFEIINIDQYRQLKDMLIKKFNLNDRLSIKSLSFIGKK